MFLNSSNYNFEDFKNIPSAYYRTGKGGMKNSIQKAVLAKKTIDEYLDVNAIGSNDFEAQDKYIKAVLPLIDPRYIRCKWAQKKCNGYATGNGLCSRHCKNMESRS